MPHIWTSVIPSGAALALAVVATATPPFASVVVDYDPGPNPVPGYTDPDAALGEPTRFTGGSFEPMVVSVLNPAWRPDELVSLGPGGHLVLAFEEPVTDDPFNPYGIDLLLFGNAFLFSDAVELDRVSCPAMTFTEGGIVAVSPDGMTWTTVPGLEADGLFPTEGWLDLVDPYRTTPGSVPADFTRPVDPTLTLSDFDCLPYEEVLELYRGSGGGIGIDLAPLGLEAVQYVRITNPEGSPVTTEIDAASDVTPRRPGDVDGDGTVDVNDLLGLLQVWGPARPQGWDADFDGDGTVGIADLLTLLSAWGQA